MGFPDFNIQKDLVPHQPSIKSEAGGEEVLQKNFCRKHDAKFLTCGPKKGLEFQLDTRILPDFSFAAFCDEMLQKKLNYCHKVFNFLGIEKRSHYPNKSKFNYFGIQKLTIMINQN